MPKPFAPPDAPVHYLPDRPVAVRHVRLELELDLEGRHLAGRATHHLRCRRDDVRRIQLDAVDMTINDVSVEGDKGTRHHHDGTRLTVELGRARARGDELALTVTYTCSPRRGLYFVGPDEHQPKRAWQCWTQGQDEDARYFWPGLDLPAEKATSEIVCTAPGGLFVLSNGDLRARTELPDGRTRWHYALDLPHPAYLVTLVCGPFVDLTDRAPETGVEVHYHVLAGQEEHARRSFGRTPAMIDFFSKRIGVPYPHTRYSQIAVADFIFGGMENTTATTLTDQVLLDERAALDHDVEGLVAHELAHQWWGDLLTCREWSEAWLNEGFATYFEYVWREHAHGRDEADAEQLNDTETYLGEAGKYQRPVVCRQYDEPIELFDAHLYDKGGRVLHMLRKDLGDDHFWASLRTYAERHARGSVETRDLVRAIEDVTGRNLEPFFDQWIRSPGHPELAATWRFDDERQVGSLRVEQKQEGERVFHFDLRVEIELAGGGGLREETFSVREKLQTFEVSLPARPRQVVVDPGDVVLKTIELEKPRPLWLRQLEAARLGVDRILAARALAKLPGPETERALAHALSRDPFWAVRAAAARALGQVQSSAARAALEAGRQDAHPKVRRAVAGALGEFVGDAAAARVLASWADEGDPSCFVEATAALALGRCRGAQAVDVLPRLLGRDSYQDVIRSRAIEGLGASGDERALPILESLFVPSASFQVRRAALAAVTRLCEGTRDARRARELLERGLADRDFRVRMEAAHGLAALGDARAVPAVERALRAELDGRARRRLREAIVEINERGAASEQNKKLGGEVERLRRELRDLRERLEKLEDSGASHPGGTGDAAAARRGQGPRRPRPPSRRGAKPGRRRR